MNQQNYLFLKTHLLEKTTSLGGGHNSQKRMIALGGCAFCGTQQKLFKVLKQDRIIIKITFRKQQLDNIRKTKFIANYQKKHSKS